MLYLRVVIVLQVSEHRLPKAFDYHRTPAPFIQVPTVSDLLHAMVLLDRCSYSQFSSVQRLVLSMASRFRYLNSNDAALQKKAMPK